VVGNLTGADLPRKILIQRARKAVGAIERVIRVIARNTKLSLE
jgi:hypothetical protein